MKNYGSSRSTDQWEDKHFISHHMMSQLVSERLEASVVQFNTDLRSSRYKLQKFNYDSRSLYDLECHFKAYWIVFCFIVFLQIHFGFYDTLALKHCRVCKHIIKWYLFTFISPRLFSLSCARVPLKVGIEEIRDAQAWTRRYEKEIKRDECG